MRLEMHTFENNLLYKGDNCQIYTIIEEAASRTDTLYFYFYRNIYK